MSDTDGWTALHYSAKCGSYELLSYFAAMGNAFDLKTDSGWNCLHIAAFYGHVNLCKYLIDQHEILVNLADNDGWRALHISAKNGNYELLTYFNAMGTDIDLKTNDGSNCLHIAALHGHLNLCKKLIEDHNFDGKITDNDGWSALHCSSRNGSRDLVTYFAEMGTNILLKANDGSNCLHIAALSGHLNLCQALIEKHKFDIHITDNEGWTALHYCVRSGNYELVAYLAEKETDIYQKTNSGWSCLHIAAFYGHLNLCKTLIENHNFDIYLTDYDEWTALHYSVRNGSYEFLSYFADMETDIELKSQDISYSLYIATFYGHLNLCKNIVDNFNLDVHKPDNDGWATLHYAARNGSYKLVTHFVELGADLDLKTNDGSNCLHISALYGHLDLCKMLIKKHNLDLHISDNYGWTALHYSVRNGSYNLVTCFADMENDVDLKTTDGSDCLHIAALSGHLHLCKTFVYNCNFDVHMTDNDGWTALHFSARNASYELITFFTHLGSNINLKTNDGSNCLYIAALYGHLNLCKKLIDKQNFDVNMTDNDGWTALHYSARNGNYELLTFFAEIETNIYLKTNDGSNCLHIAALYGYLNLCKALKDKHNFDVHLPDNDGWAALHYSARNGSYELFTYFAEMEADINLKTINENNCLHLAALDGHLNFCKTLIEKHNFDVHMADNDGWTALHFSTKNGSYELLKYFVDMGSYVDLKTVDGKNCLHIAALNGHLSLSQLLKDKHNFEIHMADDDGWTPLHYAASSGSYKLVTFFADMENDIYLETNDGRNCLSIAALGGHLMLCKTLIDKHNFDIHMTDNDGWTALHYSARNGSYELVSYFAGMKIDIDLKANDGSNCLHIAALYGHLNLCKKFIDQHKLDMHTADNDGWTALHYSAKNGSYELFTYFADLEVDIGVKQTMEATVYIFLQ